MNQQQEALWIKIHEFDIDGEPASFPFARRLAKENAWSPEYTHQVIEEYRKFLFLCAAAGHPCSPSDEVDEAWHLHLLYTDSYWNRLCKEVLPKPLHHGPTRGGKQESVKFQDWYAKTLQSYAKFFGEPPRAVWPTPEDRYRKPVPVKNEYFMIPKRLVTRVLTWMGAGAAILTGGIGCNYFAQSSSIIAPIIIPVVVLMFGGVIAYIIWSQRQGRGGDTGSGFSSTGCGGTHVGGCSGGISHGHSHSDGHGHGHGHGNGDDNGDGDGADGSGDSGGSDGGGDGGGGCGGGCGGGD